jgi:ribosomal protein L14
VNVAPNVKDGGMIQSILVRQSVEIQLTDGTE